MFKAVQGCLKNRKSDFHVYSLPRPDLSMSEKYNQATIKITVKITNKEFQMQSITPVSI